MKTNIFFVVFAFFVVLTITGCENDIDLKADDTTGLLCINANLTAGASDNIVYVAVTGKKDVTYVSNAKVVVNVNGSEVETIGGAHPLDYEHYRGGEYPVTAKFNPGDYVQVDVYFSNQHAYGGGVVPQPVKEASVVVGYAENVPYKQNMWSDNYYYSDMTTMAVTFSDADPASKNFYRMATSQSDSVKMRIDENGRYLNPHGYDLQGASSMYTKDGYECWGHCDDYNKYSYYFDNDPILSAEVVKSQGEISFLDAVDNVYKVFNDNFFNGSKATLNVMRTVMSKGSFNDYKPEKFYCQSYYKHYLLHDISYYAPRYTHRNYVEVYTITEDEYYYLKVLNARGPDSFFEFDSDFSLTGDVKLPSNVTGGSGNIFVSSCVTVSGSLYEDYIPEYVELDDFIYNDDFYNDDYYDDENDDENGE